MGKTLACRPDDHKAAGSVTLDKGVCHMALYFSIDEVIEMQLVIDNHYF